jgi:hypothetical protein
VSVSARNTEALDTRSTTVPGIATWPGRLNGTGEAVRPMMLFDWVPPQV